MKSKKYNWTLLSLEFLIIPRLFLRTRGTTLVWNYVHFKLRRRSRTTNLKFHAKIYRIVKREKIIVYACSLFPEFKFGSLYRNSPLQICCWSLWRRSDSFCRTVSKSFGEFAVCKIEAAFTVLLEAKSRSGRCPDFEDGVALILLETPQIATGQYTIRNTRQ